VRPSASAGIAVGSERHCSADDLLRDADCALYEAKRTGKERMSVFDERLHQELVSKLQLESELRRAIDEQQLFLHYQPIVDLHDEKIHGLEALVRWNHPVHGRLPPKAFLPLAEEKGLIGDVGLWVLREACRQTAIWRRRFPAHSDLTISVNFSGKELQDPCVLDKLDRVLSETGLRSNDLNIELTETILLDAAKPGNDALDRMRTRDMNLHMDDFGTGLASLSFLSRLPIRALKLDRTFVCDLGTDSALASVLQAVLAMAHARRLKVIAEGVETPEQYALLRAAGCDCGQGFYFCPPVDANAIEEMLLGRAGRKPA
jgi:EAL domain-containing protein (putative c-di-GMP-specific phosphodiesterase class I)